VWGESWTPCRQRSRPGMWRYITGVVDGRRLPAYSHLERLVAARAERLNRQPSRMGNGGYMAGVWGERESCRELRTY